MTRLSSSLSKIILLIVFEGVTLSTFPASCFSQTDGQAFAISVESHEVQIPVLVIDKSYSKGKDYGRAVSGLSAGDFQVLEDGLKQSIQNVTTVPFRSWGIQDNASSHIESSCTPGGIWAGPDYQDLKIGDVDQGMLYLVSYVPPVSPEGSCHRIQVKVQGRNKADVFARGEYCNTPSSPSDPINGTEIGKQMLEFANSTQKGKFPVSVQAIPLALNPELTRIHIAMDFPHASLRSDGSAIQGTKMAVLGLVYDKNNSLAGRFSDSACYSSSYLSNYPAASMPPMDLLKTFEFVLAQTHYQTRMDLPPGDYTLKFVVTDGKKFGRAEMALTIESQQKHGLDLSGIVLCKRFNKILEGQAKTLRGPSFVPLVAKDMEFTPAGDTLFKKRDPLIAYLEVNEPLLAGVSPVSIQLEMKIINVKTGKLELDTGAHPAARDLQKGNVIFAIVRNLTTDKLGYGTYRLEVQASDSAGNKTTWRTATFSVE